MSAPRYAIYFVPDAASALYRFGAAVLGYDCYSGRDIELAEGFDVETWPALVREPRVYGFHATLKAPFRLADGTSDSELQNALVEFADKQAAFPVGDFVVRELGAFIALVPEAACPPLDRFADDCVSEFDRFRAPLSAEERTRRLAAKLTTRQKKNLERWGYPYVFDDFRFHMTLTGPLPDRARKPAFRLLSKKFEQAAVISLSLDRVVIARQQDRLPFRVIRSAMLARSS
jgi:putative phosphonate metabolism protein